VLFTQWVPCTGYGMLESRRKKMARGFPEEKQMIMGTGQFF
jgi:hypothetical protein